MILTSQVLGQTTAAEPTEPPLKIAIHAGPTFSHEELSFQATGPDHEIRSLEFEQRVGWRLRVDLTHRVSDRIRVLTGFGFARDRFVVREEGLYPDADGAAGSVFGRRATEISMLRVDVPLKLVAYLQLPEPGDPTRSRDGLFFSMGPRLGFDVFGDKDYLDPKRPGVPAMQDGVAFEFGAGVVLQGPRGRPILVVVDYAVDLTDHFGSEFRSSNVQDAPYSTWDNLKLRTLGVSVGLEF